MKSSNIQDVRNKTVFYRFKVIKIGGDRLNFAISLLRPDKESYDAFQITSTLFCMNGT